MIIYEDTELTKEKMGIKNDKDIIGTRRKIRSLWILESESIVHFIEPSSSLSYSIFIIFVIIQ